MNTLETLQSILAEEFKVRTAHFSRETQLEELGVDSLDMLELLFKVEDRFHLKINDDMPRSLATVGDLVDYVDRLLARPAAHAVNLGEVAQAAKAAPLARGASARPTE